MNARKRLLLFRGGEELAYLKGWIERRQQSANEVDELASKEPIGKVIQSCSSCNNVYNKKSGYGRGDNGIAIILHMPNNIYSSERDMLKSESIELMKKMVQAIDVDFERCYITNLIKCESDDALNRPSLMFKNCESILKRELKEMSPEIVIVMGSDMPLKKIINENSNINWYNIEHPIMLVKSPDLKRPAWEILKMVKARIKELN